MGFMVRQDLSARHMNEFYDFAFREGIRLNKIKEQLYREDMINDDEELLFHGSRTNIDGDIRIDCNKMINDFGNGFYCGQSLEHCCLSSLEKENYLLSKKDSYKMNQDKVKLARKQYRNQGEYIEDIMI